MTLRLHSVDRCELRLLAPLAPRLVLAPRLTIAHHESALVRGRAALVEWRDEAETAARALVVRLPRVELEGTAVWERLADGGLARTSDPVADTDLIASFEVRETMTDAEAGSCLVSMVQRLARASGRATAVAVETSRVPVVERAFAGLTTRSMPSHFPGMDGRHDAVLFVQEAKRESSPRPRRREKLRVAAVQSAMRAEVSREDSYARWERLVREAADRGADVAVFPEMLTSEWLAHDTDSSDLYRAIRAIDAHRDEYLERFAALARTYAITIVAGTHYTRTARGLENVAYVVARDGSIASQAKRHPTPYEAEAFGVVPGARLATIAVEGIETAIVICYDAEFPEVARAAREAGAELMLVPYNTERASGHHRVRRGASARAVESHAYVVIAGAVGTFAHRFDDEPHHAASAAFGPSDEGFPSDGVLAEALANEESVLVVDLDFARLRESFRAGSVRPFVDR